MASIALIRSSNGSGPAALATVQAQRSPASLTYSVDTVSNFNTAGFIATAGTPKNIALASGENLLTLEAPMVFKGHVDSGNIIIDEVMAGYTDNGNSIGDVIIVKPTSAWGDEVADVLSVSLEDDGTFNSNAFTDIATGLNGKEVRFKPRVSATTSVATLTPDIDSYNIYELSAQGEALTIANPTGTPNDGDVLVIRLKDNGSTRAISYGSDYTNISGLDSLTATVAGKWHVLGVMWNAGTSEWQIISITAEA